MPTNKALIVLQENTGQVPLDPSVPTLIKQQITTLVDALAETFEDMKTTLQGAGKYDVVTLLTDAGCTRASLLDALVAETKKGRTIDLIVLGHGNTESLLLHGGATLTGGAQGSLRSLLPDAKKKGVSSLKLRLVYMCNCYASTLNDDWLAIGAKAAVGSRQRDMMPEPMTTFFVHNWLSGQTAKNAANNAYAATIPFYTVVYPPTAKTKYKTQTTKYPCPTFSNPTKMCTKTVQVPDGVSYTPHDYVKETELIVSGDLNCKF
jgi:hypothetical protein